MTRLKELDANKQVEINLEELWPGLRQSKTSAEEVIKKAVPMAKHCYYQAGGLAEYYAEPKSLAECVTVLNFAKKRGLEIHFLGLGTNVLISEKGINGLVVMTTCLNKLFIRDDLLWAESGVLLADLVAYAAAESLAGLTTLVGIPGTVGGALYMNAGAYESEISNHLAAILLYSKSSEEVFIYYPQEGDFSYRKSFLQNSDFIALAGAFQLEQKAQSEIFKQMAEVQMKRRNSQPLILPSCGSAFKRPPGHYVGKIISDLGLKGERRGEVGVSAKHAGFIVNYGGATAEEIRRFYKWIRTEVEAAYGLDLVPEVRFIGCWSEE